MDCQPPSKAARLAVKSAAALDRRPDHFPEALLEQSIATTNASPFVPCTVTKTSTVLTQH